MTRSWMAAPAIALLACGGTDGSAEDVASTEKAHTTLTPGKVAWVRMNGGDGRQQWLRTDSSPASNLTWVAGLNGNDIEIAAYDRTGTRVATAVHGSSAMYQSIWDIAIGEDESRTMVRSGSPDGMGCPPAGAGYVVELVRLELDGTCRWSYTFSHGVEEPETRLFVAAGRDGAVLVAGATFTERNFGGITVGANVSHFEAPYTPAVFVVHLDANGRVVWHRELGRALVADMDADGLDGVHLLLSPSTRERWHVVKLDPGGDVMWSRTLGATAYNVRAVRIAGAPTGDAVVAGSYLHAWEIDGRSFPEAGADRDTFLLRLDGATGAALGARRIYGGAGHGVGGVAVDHHGKVAVAGTFSNGSLNIGPHQFLAGRWYSGYVAELSPNLGTVRWANAYGDANDANDAFVAFIDVVFTADSRVMAAGDFHGTIDFGGHVRTAYLSAILLRIMP